MKRINKSGKKINESVWDYPRPPRAELCSRDIQIEFNGRKIAETNKSVRVLETSHPPVYYIPPEDIDMNCLRKTDETSFCEWKGIANYYNIHIDGKTAYRAAWSYSNPVKLFAKITDYVAFYPLPMDSCFVDGEKVKAQPGGFYGGWITSDLIGPFKGEPGTTRW